MDSIVLNIWDYFTAYGWVKNISSDLTSAEPQTDVTAVEGETVTLALFFTKNNPPNAIRFQFYIETSGTATGIIVCLLIFSMHCY